MWPQNWPRTWPQSWPLRRGQGGDVVERFAVALMGPGGALVAQRRVETHRVEDALDVVGVVALLEQRERDTAGAAARRRERRFVTLRLGPLRMLRLHVGGESA